MSGAGFLIVIVVLFLVMWMFLLRPQKRRQQAHQQMLTNVRPGDEIVTAGGLYGEVVRVGEDELTVEIAPEVEVRVARRAVAGVVPRAGDEAGESEEIESGEPTRR